MIRIRVDSLAGVRRFRRSEWDQEMMVELVLGGKLS